MRRPSWYALMPASVLETIRTNQSTTDAVFDAIYPPSIRLSGEVHWTPVVVARRAAELLVTGRGTRVLDVGSGVGKVCIVGALTSDGEFTGVEQRGTLVRIARDVVRRYAIP